MDKELIIQIKGIFKKIGKISLPLCRHNDDQIEDLCREINGLAHVGYDIAKEEERKIDELDEGFAEWAEECKLNDSPMNE